MIIAENPLPPKQETQTTNQLAQSSSKDGVWDVRRNESDFCQAMFLESGAKDQIKRGERMQACAGYLIYKILEGEKGLEHKLRYAHFCHVRLCPICQWRKSLSWRARFYQAWPQIKKAHSTARYIHLVLTVPNCPIEKLNDQIKTMNAAWKKMIDRNTWPAIGFLRSVEVTRGQDGNAHPHFHALLMVPGRYFKTSAYMNIQDWRAYWASALGVPADSLYPPHVSVCSKGMRKAQGAGVQNVKNNVDDIAAAVCEVVKYAVKGQEIIKIAQTFEGREWFRILDKEILGTKAVVTGGIIKRCINSEEVDDSEMIATNLEPKQAIEDWRYDWFKKEKHYVRTEILSSLETIWWNKQEEKRAEKKEETKKKKLELGLISPLPEKTMFYTMSIPVISDS